MKKIFRIGHINLSFHAASAALVHAIFEKYGWRVETTTSSHEEMFNRYGRETVRALEEPKGLLGGQDEATLIASEKIVRAFEGPLLAELQALSAGRIKHPPRLLKSGINAFFRRNISIVFPVNCLCDSP